MAGDPVGLPGLLVVGVGFFSFMAAVIRARSPRGAGDGETTALDRREIALHSASRA